jgi:site-specific DNA-methyltransferase (adenine-specific)
MRGDCLEMMRELPDASIDSIVTDPPYGLSFMGKGWDRGVPGVEYWTEAIRVAKPGAHLVAFGGTRTYHRLAVAIEDAGWEVRDCFVWAYGQGFPKSLDVSRQIDKAAGAEREIIGSTQFSRDMRGGNYGHVPDRAHSPTTVYRTAPATDDARRWSGWGTALKPAWEPAIVARKPFPGTVAANVLRHGTGAINVDGCRVGFVSQADERETKSKNRHGDFGSSAPVRVAYGEDRRTGDQIGNYDPPGRWPANLAHDGSPDVLDLFPRDAARFFYSAKASKADRGEGNTHPTVKPSELMAYICRLVTPPGGVVLDPFMGSGSTGVGALREGFRFVGIELDAGYLEIARNRLEG